MSLNRGKKNAPTDYCTERSSDVAGETGGAGEPRQHGVSDRIDPRKSEAGLEISDDAADKNESADRREGLQAI